MGRKMSNDNASEPLLRALRGTRHASSSVALELRRMADGVYPYGRFKDISPMIRNVWYAAAELLDPQDL